MHFEQGQWILSLDTEIVRRRPRARNTNNSSNALLQILMFIEKTNLSLSRNEFLCAKQ